MEGNFILSDYSLYQIMYLFIFRKYHLRQVLDKALLRVLLDEVNKTNQQTNLEFKNNGPKLVWQLGVAMMSWVGCLLTD